MKLFSLPTLLAFLLVQLVAAGVTGSPGPARADTIAFSLPLSGDAAELGQKFRTGAKLAAELQGFDASLFIADDGCDPDLAALAAEEIASANPAIVIGLLCNEPAKSMATMLAGTGVPVLVAGARSVRLVKDRKREGWNLWRLSPGDDYPVTVAADAIAGLWRETPYAIVDDGTIYGRSFTDLLRGEMRDRGLPPQFSDTFRAAQSTQAGLLRRLERSGVTAAFIAAATREDLFTIASNLADFDIELDLIVTEALSALPYLEENGRVPPGLRIISQPLPENAELEAELDKRGIPADRLVYEGFAAMQIAMTAMGENVGATTANLAAKTFDTVIGPVRFGADGASNYNPYDLRIWDGETFAGPDEPGAPAN